LTNPSDITIDLQGIMMMSPEWSVTFHSFSYSPTTFWWRMDKKNTCVIELEKNHPNSYILYSKTDNFNWSIIGQFPNYNSARQQTINLIEEYDGN